MRAKYGLIVSLLVFSSASAGQTVSPAIQPAPVTAPAPPPAPVPAAAATAVATPNPATLPKIDSVFPTTSYPVQERFSFEIIGERFSPDPSKDEIDVIGQGPILFRSRFRSVVAADQPESAAAGCPNAKPDELPCLEVTADGRRLSVFGFPRRYSYQGPMQVKVRVQDAGTTEGSVTFTLSRVDHRIVVTLTLALFALLAYIVYRIVSPGLAKYTIAGHPYSAITALLLDKDTDTYSLSKFQLLALSSVIFFGYLYIFLSRTLIQWQFSFPDIPNNYPSLLALSAGTTVAAAGVTGARGGKGGGSVLPSAADFITNGGLVVAERLQFFVWTLIACLGFIALVLLQDPAKATFPDMPSGLLYVMGVSSAGYLGGKAVRNPGPKLKTVSVTPMTGADADNLSVTLQGDYLDKKAKYRIEGALQTVKDGTLAGDPQAQAPQDYCSKLSFVLVKASGFAEGDHTFEITNDDGIGAQQIFTASPMKITSATTVAAGPSEATVTLTVDNYREGCTARWLPPGGNTPIEVPAAQVKHGTLPNQIDVKLVPGTTAGAGTLTLVTPGSSTETTKVTVT